MRTGVEDKPALLACRVMSLMNRKRRDYSADYFVKARMTLAEICRKKIEPMKDKDRTSTMKGSLRKKKKSFAIGLEQRDSSYVHSQAR